jgi:hypothetical protein
MIRDFHRMPLPKWLTPASRTELSGGSAPFPPSQPAAPVGGTPPSAQMSNGSPPQMGQPIIGGSLDPLSTAILMINSNPYIIGLFMLLLNLGGRFLALELTKKQEAFLQAPWIRPLLFFTVIFIATRNLVAAFWVTLLFFFIIWVVANENSRYCMIPSWCDSKHKDAADTYNDNVQKLAGQPMSFW